MATEVQEAAKLQQLAHENPDEIEVAAGREREQLEGWMPELATESRDSRGSREGIRLPRRCDDYEEGWLRGRGVSLRSAIRFFALRLLYVRIVPSKERTKVNVAYSEIAALAFTGRDTAAGKTFEAWVKKYWEKKAAGEQNIQIEPEKLD